jgi:hypothetical protein
MSRRPTRNRSGVLREIDNPAIGRHASQELFAAAVLAQQQ